jgi:hypothetical protein
MQITDWFSRGGCVAHYPLRGSRYPCLSWRIRSILDSLVLPARKRLSSLSITDQPKKFDHHEHNYNTNFEGYEYEDNDKQ